MQNEKRFLELLKPGHLYTFFFYLGAILCLFQPIAAQSGRNRNKNVEPPKSTVVTETPAAPTVPATVTPAATAADVDTLAVQRDVKIPSIVVFGEGRNISYLYSSSNYIDVALKECVNSLNERAARTGLTVVKGGKSNIDAARTRAKNETDAYVLWIGLTMKDGGYGNDVVDYVDYVVLMPQTAKFLTSGRINPSQATIPGQGTVLRIPSISSKRASPNLQIKSVGREIIQRLIRGGWIN